MASCFCLATWDAANSKAHDHQKQSHPQTPRANGGAASGNFSRVILSGKPEALGSARIASEAARKRQERTSGSRRSLR
eukprot:10414491-Alexandrium_andersonii.AAC.1